MSILDFSSGYLPPGVYVRPQTNQVVSQSVTAPSAVALVGPAKGFLTAQDTMVLSTTAAVQVSKTGADPESIVVSDANGNTYPSNYFTVTNATGVVSLELTANGSNLAGKSVYVSYNYTDANYYLPKSYTTFQQIVAAFGPAFDSANNLISPITLAAQFVFANGNPTVVVVPTNDPSGTPAGTASRVGLAQAYQQLASNDTIDIVVPLPVGLVNTPASGNQSASNGDVINAATDLKAFVDSQSAQGIFQIGIYGADSGVTTGADAIAQQCLDSRVVVAYPNALNFFNGQNNSIVKVGGWCLAAAYAGLLSSRPPQYGLTKAPISGFAGLPNSVFVQMTKAYKNQLSAAGVSVVEPTQNNVLRCRQGVTTNMTSAVTKQISVTRSADYMMSLVQRTLDNSGLIGNPTTASTPANVQIIVQSVLDSLKSSGVIIDYSGLNAVLGSSDPTTIVVTYAYKPAYELDYIVISYGIDTSSGTVAPLAA